MKEKEVAPEVVAAQVLEKIWKPVFGILVVSVVVYGGYLSFNAVQEHREKSAQEELFTIQKQVDKKTEELLKALEPKEESKAKDAKVAKKDKPAEKPKELEKTPETLVKNYGDQIAAYEKFIADHANHKAAYMAAVKLAGLAADYKDSARAQKVLAGVVDQPSHNDIFYGLLRAQLSSVLMDLNQHKEAIKILNEIVDNKEFTYFHPQALIRLGACYLETGDFEKAQATFSRVEADYPQTQAAGEARNFKKLVSMKKGAKS
jgi:predicted negative regulator of RcsB-dependent stress response